MSWAIDANRLMAAPEDKSSSTKSRTMAMMAGVELLAAICCVVGEDAAPAKEKLSIYLQRSSSAARETERMAKEVNERKVSDTKGR
ncbi:hypothetical protein LTR97_012149 [Elasticomyces elasticus]|uniref:Uncharacterized protein n=1 Tax=Elasticomyces elasticus TaxID=574655 RepID=A0AAN7VXI1_9PEZI|nr:hypothetical protein LTR97_012149 [Elasticomyces elasticus]